MGIWYCGQNNNCSKKVVAVGVKVQQWVMSHSTAVNVEAQSIPAFDSIVTCGLEGRGMTCINDALEQQGALLTLCCNHVLPAFKEAFGAELVQ